MLLGLAGASAGRATGTSFLSRTRRLSSWVWWTTSYLPPSWGYSFLMVLKQCAQVTTILVAPASLRTSTFCCGEHLEEELVAGAAGRVAGAGLAVAEDREGDAGGVEQLGHRAGGLLGAVLVGAGAADPEEVVDVVGGLDVLTEDLDREGQVLGPVEAGPGGHAPRVALVLQVLEQAAELVGERRLDEVLVAAHVDDRVDVLDVDRALLDAGAAGGARPQHVGVDDRAAVGCRSAVVGRPAGGRGRSRSRRPAATSDRADELGACPCPGPRAPRSVGEQPGRLGVRVVAQRHHEHLGRQRLVGVPRRALGLAAAALGAGGEVEQALPGEVLDLADAERGVLVELLDVLEVERLARPP